MAKKADKLLVQAKKAFQQHDKQKGRLLINQILELDYLHKETWELFHQLSAPKQSLEQFQRSFTEKYHPEKLPLLQSRGEKTPSSNPIPEATPASKKPSFFARLFGASKRSPKVKPAVSDVAVQAPSASIQASPISQEPVSRSPEPEAPISRSEPQGSAPVQHEAASASKLEKDVFSGPPPLRSTAVPVSKEAKIRILVVDDIPQTRSNVIRALRFQETFEVVGSANNGQQGMQLAMDLQPDVIIMDVNMPGMDGIAATAQIKRQLPTTEIIILTVQDDVDYMRGAMAAGARDFLAKPPMVDELITAVKRAGALAQEARAALHPVIEQTAAVTPLLNGKVITVYSPRGGAGCTTLAVNLAATLHRAETPVVVVDGNLQFGDVPVFFNTQTRYTIFDLAPHAEELDAQIVNDALAQHASGIRLLAPPRPEQAEAINSWQFNLLIKYLRGLYPYVIIDTTHRLTDITLAALDTCDLAVILVTQDIPALARLRQFMELAPALELDSSNILMVVNAYSKSIGITSEQIEQVLKQKMAAVIPMDKAAAIPAMNRGVPFMLQQEALSRPIARAIQELKEAILQRLDQLDKTAKEG